MGELRAPASLEDTSVAWLEAALREGGRLPADRSIGGLRIEAIGEGQGMMSRIARLHLEGAPPGLPSSMILKLPASDRRNRGQGEILGLYEREIFFYRELAGRTPVPTPAPLWSACDPTPWNGSPNDPAARARVEALPDRVFRWLIRFSSWALGFSRRRYGLLLEDLAPRTAGDQLALPEPAALGAAVDALAALHAGFWNDGSIDTLCWLPKVTSSPRVPRFLYEPARARLRETGRIPDAALARTDAVVAASESIYAALSGPPFTLVHGDYRFDNLFFDPADPTAPPVVADWQIPACGRGAYDLAYLLCGSLGPDEDAAAEDAWIDRYHTRLVALGVGDYGRDACQADVERCMLLMLPRVLAAAITVDFHNERGRALSWTWCDRLLARIDARPSAVWDQHL